MNEPLTVGSDPVAFCHADKAVSRRGYIFWRDGDTLIYEMKQGPLEQGE